MRLLIRYHGGPVWHERMALAIVADPGEWIVISPSNKYKLENVSAVQDVRMAPAGGGRPSGVVGEIRAFARPPSVEERREWMEEGALHAEVELERRARGATDAPSARTNVLPGPDRYAGGSWLNRVVNTARKLRAHPQLGHTSLRSCECCKCCRWLLRRRWCTTVETWRRVAGNGERARTMVITS